jgi:hypothetical protein
MSQNKTYRNSKKRHRRNKWLPVLLALGGVLLLSLAFLAFRKDSAPKAAIEVTGAPSLKVDQEKIDLGDMKFNQPAQVSFRITNAGDQTLRFTKDPYIEVVEGC